MKKSTRKSARGFRTNPLGDGTRRFEIAWLYPSSSGATKLGFGKSGTWATRPHLGGRGYSDWIAHGSWNEADAWLRESGHLRGVYSQPRPEREPRTNPPRGTNVLDPAIQAEAIAFAKRYFAEYPGADLCGFYEPLQQHLEDAGLGTVYDMARLAENVVNAGFSEGWLSGPDNAEGYEIRKPRTNPNPLVVASNRNAKVAMILPMGWEEARRAMQWGMSAGKVEMRQIARFKDRKTLDAALASAGYTLVDFPDNAPATNPRGETAVQMLERLNRDAQHTFNARSDRRTPFDALCSAEQNAFDTYPGMDRGNEQWAQFALDSLRSMLCDSEPESVCQWFKRRGVNY